MIRETSSALKSLGFNSGKMNQDEINNGISLDEFNASSNKSSFEAAAITKQPLSAILRENQFLFLMADRQRILN